MKKSAFCVAVAMSAALPTLRSADEHVRRLPADLKKVLPPLFLSS